MKHNLSTTLGLIIFMTFVTSSIDAQTVGPGPYYANPSWDQKLDCTTPSNCPRFVVLSNWANAAVLDRETGLVWERSPLAPCENVILCSPAVDPGTRTWNAAQARCNIGLTVGNRGGWRLPTLQELRSLVDYDPGDSNHPRLPPGHPFLNVQSSAGSSYWSVTTDTSCGICLFNVSFFDGSVASVSEFFVGFVWCVRGGQGVNPPLPPQNPQ